MVLLLMSGVVRSVHSMKLYLNYYFMIIYGANILYIKHNIFYVYRDNY